MADTPSLAEQMQQNLADLTAQNQSILANIQHSNAVGAANEAASMAQTDAFISALETGGAPHVEAFAPPMMDGQPATIIDGGQTPGLHVSQSLHDDGDDVVEALRGFDLDGDDAGGHAGEIHNLQDAVHLAQQTGGVAVIEEVIVIDPNAAPADTHDHYGGDFSS